MVFTVRAVHTFVAEHSDELEFSAGEEIVILEKDEAFGDGWWRGRNSKGEEGLFPATYITDGASTPQHEHIDLPVTKASPEPSTVDTNGDIKINNGHLAAPTIPIPDESPRGTHDASGGLLDGAVAAVETTAVTVGNVMGRTIGEIQDVIESITAKPESDDEEELGIGQNARAKLAEQARLANEQRENNPNTDGSVSGLVYSDESEDEDDDVRRSPGIRGITSPALNGFHSSPIALDQSTFAKAPSPVAPPLISRSSNHSSIRLEPSTSGGTLEPPAHIPSTPPFEKPTNTARSSNSGFPSKPPNTWTVDDVVVWAQAKGFDESIYEKFQGEFILAMTKLTA
ncbi:uncharacterized protein IL334_005452 [Kwoniella shivajii]|uniref:SH3 domain-containing protein n=1 Tax=Kwoniella shivajii TaxID=564305 RepID=A0ABZ1D3Q8_9TREE|nr:hypothetical protein IL334_005452 [Kwoniella shivajii]